MSTTQKDKMQVDSMIELLLLSRYLSEYQVNI